MQRDRICCFWGTYFNTLVPRLPGNVVLAGLGAIESCSMQSAVSCCRNQYKLWCAQDNQCALLRLDCWIIHPSHLVSTTIIIVSDLLLVGVTAELPLEIKSYSANLPASFRVTKLPN